MYIYPSYRSYQPKNKKMEVCPCLESLVGYCNIVSLMSQCSSVAVRGTQLVYVSICLAALPCKRVKLTCTSESDDESQSPLRPKGVTGQAADLDTHIQSPVTIESSDQPIEQKKVLEESDAIEQMDIETVSRKREFSVIAKVNKPHRQKSNLHALVLYKAH